jgi:hypothetical protein
LQIASHALPAYSNTLMGQQHRVRAKRTRRKAYLERKRAANKTWRRPATKSRAKDKKEAAAKPATRREEPAEEVSPAETSAAEAGATSESAA